MRTTIGVVVRGLGGLIALAGPCLLLAACDEGPVLMTEEFLTKGTEDEQYMGGACMGVTKGDGMGGGTAPGAFGTAGSATVDQGYSYSYEGTGNGVHFKFMSYDGEVLAERTYDAKFLDSGQRDVVTVEVYGETRRFVHHGAKECEPIREPDLD